MAQQPESVSINPPRGTHDVLPSDSHSWQKLEAVARSIFHNAHYQEIRTPIFEHTEVFKRSVGETTDIVKKEMYTFLDRAGRSLTLRPENTAGVVRAYLNGGLSRQSPPVKLWYIGPMFRYERPQAGRQRQFHQIGAEAFGAEGPLIDAELIFLAFQILSEAGVTGLRVQVNSIGCVNCRPIYRKALQDKYRSAAQELCPDCQDRLEHNPLRLLDCKVESCCRIFADAPAALDYLCAQCKEHWDGLIGTLNHQKLKFTINTRLVRGLDYYSRTVFEITSDDPRLGAQSTVCGGGRYDYLVEQFGGPQTPGVGWSIGMERLILILQEKEQVPFRNLVFVVSTNPNLALKTVLNIRETGIPCEMDFGAARSEARSFTRQLQLANKMSASWAVIIGEDEISSGSATLKNMNSGNQEHLKLAELPAALKARINATTISAT